MAFGRAANRRILWSRRLHRRHHAPGAARVRLCRTFQAVPRKTRSNRNSEALVSSLTFSPTILAGSLCTTTKNKNTQLTKITLMNTHKHARMVGLLFLFGFLLAVGPASAQLNFPPDAGFR